MQNGWDVSPPFPAIMTAPAKVIRDKATKQRYSKRLNGRRRTLAIRNKRLRPNNSMSDVAIVSELKLFHGAMGVGAGPRRTPMPSIPYIGARLEPSELLS